MSDNCHGDPVRQSPPIVIHLHTPRDIQTLVIHGYPRCEAVWVTGRDERDVTWKADDPDIYLVEEDCFTTLFEYYKHRNWFFRSSLIAALVTVALRRPYILNWLSAPTSPTPHLALAFHILPQDDCRIIEYLSSPLKYRICLPPLIEKKSMEWLTFADSLLSGKAACVTDLIPYEGGAECNGDHNDGESEGGEKGKCYIGDASC
jgi:hypothetical protein